MQISLHKRAVDEFDSYDFPLQILMVTVTKYLHLLWCGNQNQINQMKSW